jgi:predicted ATP-grasp superfamily ATP-dependent carboligase
VKRVLFLESQRDQAITIAKYLKRSKNYELFFDEKEVYEGDEEFDIIVPGGATSTLKYVQKFGTLRIGEISFPESNLITYDKIEMLKIVEKIGVPIPKTFTNINDLDFFPVFFKSLREDGYNERGIVHNEKELDTIRNSKTIFFQEYIRPKGTYAVGFIANKGVLLTSFSQEEKISYPYHGGSGVVLSTIEDQRLVEYTKRIVKEINYSGWGLAEFKYCDRRNDYVFMEVNAKFWASIEFAFLNNPDILDLIFGVKIKPQNVKTAIYTDRMLVSNWREIVRSIPYLFTAKHLKTQNLTTVLKKRFFGKKKK